MGSVISLSFHEKWYGASFANTSVIVFYSVFVFSLYQSGHSVSYSTFIILFSVLFKATTILHFLLSTSLCLLSLSLNPENCDITEVTFLFQAPVHRRSARWNPSLPGLHSRYWKVTNFATNSTA